MTCAECGLSDGVHAIECSHARDGVRPRPRAPTTQPMERYAMATSWVREAARVYRALGYEERAVRLELEADDADRDA